MTPKYVRDANRRQQELCAREVARIRAAGERYVSGRLVAEGRQSSKLTFLEIVALRRKLDRPDVADIIEMRQRLHERFPHIQSGAFARHSA